MIGLCVAGLDNFHQNERYGPKEGLTCRKVKVSGERERERESVGLGAGAISRSGGADD